MHTMCMSYRIIIGDVSEQRACPCAHPLDYIYNIAKVSLRGARFELRAAGAPGAHGAGGGAAAGGRAVRWAGPGGAVEWFLYTSNRGSSITSAVYFTCVTRTYDASCKVYL